MSEQSKVLFAASSQAELQTAIRALEITVAPRHEGRSSNDVEQWAIHRLLRSMPEGRFSYPVTLTRTEKPDFLLSIAGHVIGIEHTEAVSHVEAVIDSEQGKLAAAGMDVPNARMMDARSPDDPRMSKAEAQAVRPQGTPFVGDELEENWLHAMQHFIGKKVEKFARYQRSDSKAVLVYDNWPATGLDVSKAASMLHDRLKKSATFALIDSVFVLRHDTIINLTASDLRFFKP